MSIQDQESIIHAYTRAKKLYQAALQSRDHVMMTHYTQELCVIYGQLADKNAVNL